MGERKVAINLLFPFVKRLVNSIYLLVWYRFLVLLGSMAASTNSSAEHIFHVPASNIVRKWGSCFHHRINRIKYRRILFLLHHVENMWNFVHNSIFFDKWKKKQFFKTRFVGLACWTPTTHNVQDTQNTYFHWFNISFWDHKFNIVSYSFRRYAPFFRLWNGPAGCNDAQNDSIFFFLVELFKRQMLKMSAVLVRLLSLLLCYTYAPNMGNSTTDEWYKLTSADVAIKTRALRSYGWYSFTLESILSLACFSHYSQFINSVVVVVDVIIVALVAAAVFVIIVSVPVVLFIHSSASK